LATSETWDPVTSKWSPAGQLSQDLHRHRVVTISNGNALVMGGFTQSSPSHVVVEVEEYNQSAKTWALVGSIISERRNHSLTVLEDGSVLVISGESNLGRMQPTSELYHPE